MSHAALKKAMRDRLQEVFGLDGESCELMIDGKPKPSCGELFIAIHGGGWRAGEFWGGDLGIDEMFGGQVTVTRRLGEFPRDRWGILWSEEMEPMLRRIVLELAGSADNTQESQTRYLVLQKACEYINLRDPDNPVAMVGYAGGFVEPLKFVDGGSPMVKGPEWFTSPPLLGEEGEQVECGVAQTLTFFGARRPHNICLAT